MILLNYSLSFSGKLRLSELVDEENSVATTTTRQVLAQKEKELEEMRSRVRTRDKLVQLEAAMQREREKRTSAKTRWLTFNFNPDIKLNQTYLVVSHLCIQLFFVITGQGKSQYKQRLNF
jgi:hypothetical protein